MNFNNGSFCPLPFVHQEKFFNNKHNICCYGQQTQSDNPTQNSIESFNSVRINSVRTKMLAGDRPEECSSCYKFEDQGGHSPRMFETPAWLNLLGARQSLEHNIEKFKANEIVTPTSYDLRYSNTCTLKCRMCNSGSSTSINQEYKKLQSQWPRKFWTTPNSRTDHEILLNEDLQKIYLAGGEPLVEPLNLDLLRRVADVNPAVNLVINTSLNRLTDDWLAVLNRFTNLTFTISLDGIGTVNDYIRHGSDFATVMQNIERVRSCGHELLFSSCISLYNIFDVSNIVNYVANRFPEAADSHGINIVNDVEELFVENVPPELRSALIEELKNLSTSIGNTPCIGVQNLILILEQDNFNPNKFENFIKYTTILDEHRGESIVQIQPKFVEYFDK
jgi:sulfatase maturation enzyme AslB (radical SAM superfamily)